LTGPVVVDGYTQPGSRPNTAGPGAATNALQTIVLDGTQAPGYGIRGLVFTGGASTLRGLVVQNFTSNEVELWGNNNVAEGNAVPGGIDVMSGSGNRLGGTTPAARNDGAVSVLSDYNRVVGNIGPVGISGSHNTIGGTTPAERNVISGGRPGLFLSGSDNVIQGNFIGTDVTGTVRVGNRPAGVYLAYTAQRNLIGWPIPGPRHR